jgi:hypothetical protein
MGCRWGGATTAGEKRMASGVRCQKAALLSATSKFGVPMQRIRMAFLDRTLSDSDVSRNFEK